MSHNRDALKRLNFSGAPRLELVRQTEAAECGLACLAMIASYYGHGLDLAALRRRFSLSLKGMSLPTLLAAAGKMKLAGRPLRAELDALHQVKLPAVLHWDFNHFVVLKAVDRRGVSILDPAFGERRLGWREASKHYTGVAIELQPSEGFERKDERRKFRLSQLWSRLTGLKRSLAQLLALSAVAQIFILLSPFYAQLVIDEVLTKFDVDLLAALAIGFALFTLIYIMAYAIRAHLVLYIGGMMSYQMMINIFRHMVRLPQDYFDKRHIGDIVSRFSSTGPIKNMLTEGLAAGALDGVMAVSTLVLMYVYSPLLASVVALGFLLNVGLRLGLYRLYHLRSEEAILAKAREHTNFMETVRGILSIKLFGREAQRQQIWQNQLAEVVNTDVKLGRVKIAFDVANKLIIGLELVLLIYLAARMALAGGFTIGMIFAFLSYRTLFSEKAVALVDLLVNVKLLDLHLDRLADMTLTEAEPEGETLLEAKPLKGELELRGVCFRYADFEPEVLRGFDFKIAPGESVAISGPSGGGKTTMMKLMLGLLSPQQGEILVDGVALRQYGLHHFRAQVAAVMQDDRLFAGSIADNIAFFDPDIDMDWVIECAKTAAIHDEIAAMPMNYDTLIGDMGTILSGGQKQRVMLARALYTRPKMLFLDEGTAHLDVAIERRVNQAVAALGISRVIIAHRPETIRSAERHLVMQDGRLVAPPDREGVVDIAKMPFTPS